MRLRSLILLALAIFGLMLLVHSHEFRDTTIKTPQPCSIDAPPCIKLTTGGTIYKLNDFRMLPGRCIEFISLPDHAQHTTCQPYHMDWIGPDNVGQTI